jgi:hypothetical protein
MRNLLLCLLPLAFLTVPNGAGACPDVFNLGTLIDSEPLNGNPDALTATVGPTVRLSDTPLRYCPVAAYSVIVFGVEFLYGGQAGAISTTVTGGAPHTVAASYMANEMRVYVDQIEEGTPDTSCTIPTTSKLSVGATQSAGSHIEGHISSLKIYSRPSQRS